MKQTKTITLDSVVNLHKPVVIPSLRAAGKLALAARLVTTANAKNISQRIEQMEEALNAYDNEIIANSNIVQSHELYYI